MDLIGDFYPKLAAGKYYALTVICMLTDYTLHIPLKSKPAGEVEQVYVDDIYANSGGLSLIFVWWWHGIKIPCFQMWLNN